MLRRFARLSLRLSSLYLCLVVCAYVIVDPTSATSRQRLILRLHRLNAKLL